MVKTHSTKSRLEISDEGSIIRARKYSAQDHILSVPCPTLPDLPTHCPKWMCSQGFVTYLLQTVFKPEVWRYYGEDEKVEISEYVKALCEIKEFMVTVENETFELFYGLVNVLEKVTEHELIPDVNEHTDKKQDNMPCSPLTPPQVPNPVYANLSHAVKSTLTNHMLT